MTVLQPEDLKKQVSLFSKVSLHAGVRRNFAGFLRIRVPYDEDQLSSHEILIASLSRIIMFKMPG